MMVPAVSSCHKMMILSLRKYASPRVFTSLKAALALCLLATAFCISLMTVLDIGTYDLNYNYRLDYSDLPNALEQTELKFLQRREAYSRVCDSKRVSGDAQAVFYHKNSHLSVCYVAKVGCTFWNRIFHFLYNETWGQKVTSAFDIDRFDIHTKPRKKVQVLNYSPWRLISKWYMDHTVKVLFTRDPFARLWSVYVDKFILPDSWLDHGAQIVLQRQEQQQQQQQQHQQQQQPAASDSGKGPEGHSGNESWSDQIPVRCAGDVSFEEFLRYALFRKKDPHWMPIHDVCNPCLFRPRFVGKMESFSADSLAILKHTGLGKLLEGRNHSQYMQDEVRMLTSYHFRLFQYRPLMSFCLKHSGVAYRLWQAFVFNGYIAKDITIPKEKALELDMADTNEASLLATRLLLDLHERSPKVDSTQLKTHRRRVMTEHYRALGRPLLEEIVNAYRDDFALFGYEARPRDIFAQEQKRSAGNEHNFKERSALLQF